MKSIRLYGTCSAGGALTVNGPSTVSGVVYGITWIDGTLADGVDAVISAQGADSSGTIITLTDANDDAVYYPRADSCDETGAVLSIDDTMPVFVGKPRMVIASGGSGGIGGCVLHILEV